MKLGTSLFLGASGLMCLGLTAALSVQGCGSSSNGNTSDGGGGSGGGSGSSSGSGGGSGSGSGGSGGDDGGGSSGTSTVPPTLPTGTTATTQTTPHNFAMHHLHLGDEIDPATSKADWPNYGYNIDGLTTIATSTNVCTLATDANKKNQADGPGGIDNSFGANIVPLISAVSANPSATLTTSIESGSFTLMLDITGLDNSAPTTQTASGLTGQLFGGVHFYQGPNAPVDDASLPAPTFTPADNWPLDTSFVTSDVEDGGVLATPVTSNIVFGSPYVVNGTFVTGAPTEVKLALTLQGVPLSIDIKHAQITFNHTTATHADKGVISGVILTTDLITALQGVAGNISTSFCPTDGGAESPAFAQIVTAIQQAADIMHDGTNVAGTPCDAISIGLGFDADEIGLPQVAGVPSTGTNPCD